MKKPGCKTGMARCGFLLMIALSICMSSCLSWFMEKPTITVRKISITPLSLTEMSLVLQLEVQNTNHFDLTLTSLEYTIYLNNEDIGNGRLEKEILVPASSTTPIRFPVATKFNNLGKGLKTIIFGNDLPYRIAGTALVKTAFGSASFPLSKEGRISDLL